MSTPQAVVPAGTPSPELFPFLDLKAQFAEIGPEIMEATWRVLESQHFILGPEVSAFEKEVAEAIGAQFALSCASGSDALLLALMAIGVSRGDEVITTPFTFMATAGAIVRLGAVPVFVDIDPSTYNIDPTKIEGAITERTRAIMPVHLFGLAADMDPIVTIASRHNIPVVEDAAQAIGAQYRNRQVGTIGEFGCFSFFPSKNLGGAGDGGLITTNDGATAERLRMIRVHGSRTKYHYELLGINSRLDALQAAILRVKLQHLEKWTEQRRRNAAHYRSLFAEFDLLEQLRVPPEDDGGHVYNQFVIWVEQRDSLREYLRQRGIPTEIYYPSPLHLQPALSTLGYKPGDLPHSEAAAGHVLALPIFPELTEGQRRMVVQAIAEFHNTNFSIAA